MLHSLVGWLLLGAGAAMVGGAILTAAKHPGFRHWGDQFIVATWLGLLAFAAALLGMSIFLPLRPGISFVLLGSMTALAAWSKSARVLLKIPRGRRTDPAFAGIGILAAVAALNSTRLVQAYDTGLYHYQLVRWLTEYGTVRGLALLHFRFGFTSSWFALAAPFDFGPIEGRVSGLIGSLAIFLALLHFALAISRILQRRAERSDWFLAGGYPLIFLVCFSWAFEVSLSPDLPIWILTVLIGWLMLVEVRPDVPRGSEPKEIGYRVVPLILAFGAVSIKLSAAPMAVVAGLFYLFDPARKSRATILAGVLAGMLLVPYLAANFASSGCPLFPSTLLCANVPWGVGKVVAQASGSYSLNSGRWGEVEMPPGATSWNWIPAWFSQRDRRMLLALSCACLTGFLAVGGWRKDQRILWVLALSLGGMGFLFINAPNPRFGIGYFALCPALFVATAGPDLESWARSHFPHLFHPVPTTPLASILFGMSALFVLHAGLRELAIEKKIQQFGKSSEASASRSWRRLLLAPALPKSPGDLTIIENRKIDRIASVQLARENSNGFEYWLVLGADQCWAVSLPCLPEAPEGHVGLRRPESGFRSGFMRTSSRETAEQIQ
jgi:hypothetical protein